MLWQDWVASAAAAMGMTTTQGGIFLAFFVTLVLIVIILISTRGRQADKTIPYVTLISIIFFTWAEWFPLMLGTMIALVVAIFIAQRISKSLGE